MEELFMNDKLFNFRKITFIFLLLFFAYNSSFSQQNSWDQQGKDFVNLLKNGQFETAFSKMSEVMKGYLPVNKLQQLWIDLEKQAGEFQKVEKVKVIPVQKWFQVNVTCSFVKADMIVRVVFNKQNLVDGLFFLPTDNSPPEYITPSYVNRSTFKEEEIKFGLPNWQLPGTLTIPKGEKTFPAVILVHGSGPNDRDETIGPNRPFRDMAWGLVSNGILVLRYDKRTKVHGQKMVGKNLTVFEETIEDVLLAIKLLQKRPEINSKKIFVLGHSLGAMLAPEIASQSKEIAGIIMLAGPARSIEELSSYQFKYLQSLKPVQTKEEIAELDSVLGLFEALKNRELPDSVNVYGARAYYYYDLQKRNQVNFAKSLTIPQLILQGERDYQVTMVDFQIWQKELVDYKNVDFISYPALNHLFIAGKEKSTPQEYSDKQRHVDEKVIQDISNWIKKIESNSEK